MKISSHFRWEYVYAKQLIKKIEIDVNDKRIRKSDVEIITETKSYFFNFLSVGDFTKSMGKRDNWIY